jgi:hypothetical protein
MDIHRIAPLSCSSLSNGNGPAAGAQRNAALNQPGARGGLRATEARCRCDVDGDVKGSSTNSTKRCGMAILLASVVDSPDLPLPFPWPSLENLPPSKMWPAERQM